MLPVGALPTVRASLTVDGSVRRPPTQVQLLFTHALEQQRLLEPATDEIPTPDGDDAGPILVAWSDNGPEMTSGDTREFVALMTIAQWHGRPGTPTDQAQCRELLFAAAG